MGKRCGLECRMSKMSDRVMVVLAAASGWGDYRRAKKLAEKCDVIEQYALVDSFKEARARLLGVS